MGFAGELYDQFVDVHWGDALGDDLVAELEHSMKRKFALRWGELDDVGISGSLHCRAVNMSFPVSNYLPYDK